MRTAFLVAASAWALTVAGCSSGGEQSAGGHAADTIAQSTKGVSASPIATTSATPPAPECADYRQELAPGDMVMIYHAVSGIEPPTSRWAEMILPRFDRTIDPEGAWKQANAQIRAQYDAVATTRCITLRTGANIRSYDSVRGGLVIGNFSPDSSFPFNELGENVRLRIRNADTASLWKMSAERAQGLIKGSYSFSQASLLARLRIVSARPSASDGIVEADVESFDVISGLGDRAKLATITVGDGS